MIGSASGGIGERAQPVAAFPPKPSAGSANARSGRPEIYRRFLAGFRIFASAPGTRPERAHHATGADFDVGFPKPAFAGMNPEKVPVADCFRIEGRPIRGEEREYRRLARIGNPIGIAGVFA
jgi:hypothetical protein